MKLCQVARGLRPEKLIFFQVKGNAVAALGRYARTTNVGSPVYRLIPRLRIR